MIDPHFARSLAMSYAVEDFYGPYELISGLAKHYPNAELAVRQHAAAATLRQLLMKGLIELHLNIPGSPYPSPLLEAQALSALQESSFWLPFGGTKRSQIFWFKATEAGTQAFEAGHFMLL